MPDVDLHVIAPRWSGGKGSERVGEATVHRVEPPEATDDFFGTARLTNEWLENYAIGLWEQTGSFDLVHVHDWLGAFAAVSLKHTHKVPLVSTIHATERGRGRGGLGSDQARSIDQVEWQLTYESWRVIACSEYMAREIADYFQCPRDKVDVVPNGVDTSRFDRLERLALKPFRARYALPSEKIVFSVGRVVREKGLHLVLEALPMILAQQPATKVIVAGKGPELDALRSEAEELGVDDKVLLLGFVPDEDRDRFYKVADCAVFPSLYEPFGIVALEAMAAKCPVIVSEVGGLKNVVQHGETGVTVHPNDVESLAWGILHTLEHPQQAAAQVRQAYRIVREKYNWEFIARMTRATYRTVIAERALAEW
jgi:glycosyltransferase involved in cell wall biosynthesis